MRSIRLQNKSLKTILAPTILAAALLATLNLNGLGAPVADGAPQAAGHMAKGALPPAGAYAIDPDHSFAFFSAWHHIVGRVRGRFNKVTGSFAVGATPAECSIDVSIDTASIDTSIAERDDDLRSDAFFDVKKFPAMTYSGRGIRKTSQNTWVMDGTLTIRGVARPVLLTFTYDGLIPDTPVGKPARASLHGTAAVHRGDFGMVRDNLMELGPSPAGPDVDIEINVEADAVPPAK